MNHRGDFIPALDSCELFHRRKSRYEEGVNVYDIKGQMFDEFQSQYYIMVINRNDVRCYYRGKGNQNLCVGSLYDLLDHNQRKLMEPVLGFLLKTIVS